MKFTPGPWTYLRQSNDSGEPVFIIGAEAAQGENKFIARIASRVGWSDYAGKTKHAERPGEANARLIAAAPELFNAVCDARNALQTIKDHFDVSTEWHISQSANVLEQIDELTILLAKISGES